MIDIKRLKISGNFIPLFMEFLEKNGKKPPKKEEKWDSVVQKPLKNKAKWDI